MKIISKKIETKQIKVEVFEIEDTNTEELEKFEQSLAEKGITYEIKIIYGGKKQRDENTSM